MVLRNLYQVLEQCALRWIYHQSCMCPVNPLSVSAAAKLLLPEVVFVSTMKNWNQTWCGDNERWFLLSKARSCWCPLSYVEAQWMKFHFKLGLLNTLVYVSSGSWQEQASMWDMWTGKAHKVIVYFFRYEKQCAILYHPFGCLGAMWNYILEWLPMVSHIYWLL